MKNLVIDIETVPTQKDGALAAIRSGIKPPGNISKQETIDKWMAENADTAADEAYRKTALNGTEGEIVCIGWSIDDNPVETVYRELWQSETTMLANFYALLSPANERTAEAFADLGIDNEYRIIGHNVLNFDARFLFQRSVVCGVKPSFNLRQDERYNGGKCYDTMLAWAGWGNRISLVNLCAVLNIPVKQGDITGATVWDAVQAGRIAEVAEYCKTDVEATRSAYIRMTFQEGL